MTISEATRYNFYTQINVAQSNKLHEDEPGRNEIVKQTFCNYNVIIQIPVQEGIRLKNYLRLQLNLGWMD